MIEREYSEINTNYSFGAAARNFVRKTVQAMGQPPLDEEMVNRVALKINRQFAFLNKPTAAKPSGEPSA